VNLSNRFDQILLDGVFQQVAPGTGAHGTVHVALVAIHAENEDRCLRRVPEQLRSCLNAIELFHRDIENSDIGLMPLGGLNRFQPGRDVIYDIEPGLLFENASKSLAKQVVIVCKKKSNGGHTWASWALTSS
jgi:hypothetical protein